MKESFGSKAFDGVNIVLLLLLALATLYPLYYVLVISISDANAVMRGVVRYWPVGVNMDTYKIIMRDPNIITAYVNTLLYVSVGTCINLLFTMLCAYPLSKKDFYGRNAFMVMIVITMFFSGGLIPNYLVVQHLGMINTLWAIVLPTAINAWFMIIMRTFFMNIPQELFEAAHMDGAGMARTFVRIVIPLSVPSIMTIGMFYAVAHWNSFFPALIYLNEKAKYPLQIILRNIVIGGELTSVNASMAEADTFVAVQNVKYAVIIIVIAPILLIYPFVQKYFIQGIMVGSLKG